MVAIRVATSDGIEVREIIWIGQDWNRDNRKGETANDEPKDCLGWSFGAVEDIKECFGDEHIENRQHRKEVTETDVHVPGDTDIAIKENKENTEVLCNAVLERIGQEGTDTIGLLLTIGDANTIEGIASSENKKKKKR